MKALMQRILSPSLALLAGLTLLPQMVKSAAMADSENKSRQARSFGSLITTGI